MRSFIIAIFEHFHILWFLLLRSMKSSSTNVYLWFRNAMFNYCDFTSVSFFAIIKTSQSFLNLQYLAFQYFDYERTWWQLYQRHVVRTSILTFLLLSLGRYLYWWTISHRRHHPLIIQSFGTDMVYIYTYYWNLQFLINVCINKTKVPLYP